MPPTPGGAALVTDVQVNGFKTPGAGGTFTVLGHGMCRLRIASFTAPYVHATSNPIELQFHDVAVQLPHTFEMKKPAAPQGGEHIAEIYSIGAVWGGLPGADDKKANPGYAGCVVAGPASAGNFVLRKSFSTFAGTAVPAGPAAPTSSGAPGKGGPPPPPPPPVVVPGQPLAATGKITGLQVPGGSFAQDEAQKLQVSGSGGCGMDLAIKRTEAGASYAKSWPVNPVFLDPKPTLYNGTSFETLAEGSYSATVTGKNGCSGTATIDFKVTAKTSVKSVKGQPTISLEKPPISGSAYKRTKDSGFNLVVKLPQSVKDEPSVGCCDLEWSFKNAYGGWEVLPGSPFTDSSFGGAVTGASGSLYKSVSGFKEGSQWRVRARAYKYKAEFDWSEWLELQVDQN